MCVAPNNARGHYVWWRADITRNEGPSSDRAKFYRTHNCLCNKTQHQKWNLSQEVFGNLGNGHLIFHRQCLTIWPPLCNSFKMCSFEKSVNLKSLHMSKISRTGIYGSLGHLAEKFCHNGQSCHEGYFLHGKSSYCLVFMALLIRI